MAGRIPQQFIDDLLNRVDIVDIIDSRVPLRKAGRDYQARCPFHEEKSPSFTVSQNKQFYHCFGCGAHGTAISFLMEYEHMEFIEALKELAHKTGVQLPETENKHSEKKPDNDLYEIMQQAASFYRQQLGSHSSSEAARDYLKNRGLTSDIAKEFSIGFAPPGWDNLLKALSQSKQIEDSLVSTGMTVRKEDGRSYDRFRNRITFPIRDKRGRVIAFGGRVIDDNDNPKYLNSPESPLFHKGRELYGLYEARQALRNIEQLLIVEGYMDVVALAQHGIRYAVATLGTALTSDHVTPLFRTAPEAIFCFDGDRAGRDAAWKALDIMLPEIKDGRTARFMFLPDGEDPDTLVRKIGHDSFEQQVRSATPLSTFLLDNLLQHVDMGAIDGKARLVDLARPKLAKITNTIFKHMLIKELAARINMNAGELTSLLGEKTTKNRQQPTPRHNKQQKESRKLSPVRTAITLLLNHPQLAKNIKHPQQLLTLEEPGIRLLVQLLELIQHTPHINCGTILEHWRDNPEGKHLGKLARATITTPEDGQAAEFEGALNLLHKQCIEQEYTQLLRKGETIPLTTDEKRKLIELQAKKRTLAQPHSDR
ncbi:DNA primase [Pseudomonadota bacterium]